MVEIILALNLITIFLLVFIIFALRKEIKQSLGKKETDEIIVDTSVLIDGRILEVADAGFIMGKLVVPEFVIEELQKVADSSDSLRRHKGRKGLKTIRNLQKTDGIVCEITDIDFPEESYVDEKIVKLAKVGSAKVLTVDYNLNNVAKIHKIPVLNINELAKTLRPLFLPGEKIEVKIVQKGKENKQGVGYLEDGTMVVVEDGQKYLGKRLECLVSRILQTEAGRMVFARPKAYGLDRVGAPKHFIRIPAILPWQKQKKKTNFKKNNHQKNYHR